MGKNCKNRWLFNENWWFSEGFDIPRIDSSLLLIFLKIHRSGGSLNLIFFKIPRSDGSLKNQRTTQHQSITGCSVEIGGVASPHWRRGLGLQPIFACILGEYPFKIVDLYKYINIKILQTYLPIWKRLHIGVWFGNKNVSQNWSKSWSNC
jgi:hypothetical protein